MTSKTFVLNFVIQSHLYSVNRSYSKWKFFLTRVLCDALRLRPGKQYWNYTWQNIRRQLQIIWPRLLNLYSSAIFYINLYANEMTKIRCFLFIFFIAVENCITTNWK